MTTDSQQKKVGNPRPRLYYIKNGDMSWGDLAIELGHIYGIDLLEHQKLIIKAWLARNEKEGLFACINHCLSSPRQNGKTEVIIVLILFALLVLNYRVLYTAHRGDTAMEVFGRLANIFENNPDLDDISYVRRSNGKEAIELTIPCEDGPIKTLAQFRTRSNNSGRGTAKVNLLIYDEAQMLTSTQAEDLDALTLVTADKGCLKVYAGTPPKEDEAGDVFRNLRKSSLKFKDECDHTWLEWSVDEPKSKYDKKWWYETNPGLGILIDERTFAAQAEGKTDEGFNREYLGYWDETAQGEDHPINSTNWRLCKTDKPPVEIGVICYGVKFSVDGKSAALSVCNKTKDNKPYIETIDYKSVEDGLGWIYDWLTPSITKVDKILLDGTVNCETVKEHLLNAGAKKKQIQLAKSSDMSFACQSFVNDIKEHDVLHSSQKLLNSSCINCVKRPIGRLGGWGFENFLDGVAIVAESAALALYCAKSTKKRNRNKGRTW